MLSQYDKKMKNETECKNKIGLDKLYLSSRDFFYNLAVD